MCSYGFTIYNLGNKAASVVVYNHRTSQYIFDFSGQFAGLQIIGVTSTGSGASCQPLQNVKSGIPFNIDGTRLVVSQPTPSGTSEFPQLKACLRAVGGEQHWTIELANVRPIARNHRRLQAMVPVRVSETGNAELIVSVGMQHSNPWPLCLLQSSS